MSLYLAPCVLSAYSFCCSFEQASLCLSCCCQYPSLENSTLGSLSRNFLPINSFVGDMPVTGCGTETESPGLPSSSLSFQAGQCIQSPPLHCFVASRVHLSCAGSPNILIKFKTVLMQMVVHYHYAHILVDHVS